MRTLSCLLLAGACVIAAAAPSQAQEEREPSIDTDGLRQILVGLGYEPKKIEAGTVVAWQVELEHPGETRKHTIGIDAAAGTLFIIGGGFAHAPDPAKASNDWFRRLLKVNNQIAPSYIFLNDFNVFGLTTVMGNVNVTPARLKAKLKEHVSNFDGKLVPLIKELPGKQGGDAPPPPAA